MSHEIETSLNNYISFGMSDKNYITLLYGSLQAEKYNAGCSGSGDEKAYTRKDIELAYERLKYMYAEPNLLAYEDVNKLQLSENVINNIYDVFSQGATVVVIDNSTSLDEAFNDVCEFYKGILKHDFDSIVIEFN